MERCNGLVPPRRMRTDLKHYCKSFVGKKVGKCLMFDAFPNLALNSGLSPSQVFAGFYCTDRLSTPLSVCRSYIKQVSLVMAKWPHLFVVSIFVVEC